MRKGRKFQSKFDAKKSTARSHHRRLSGKSVNGNPASARAMDEPDSIGFADTFKLDASGPSEHDVIGFVSLEDELEPSAIGEPDDADPISEDFDALPEGRDDYEFGKSGSKEYLLHSYFRDIARIPLLSAEETTTLFKKFERAQKKNESQEAAKIKEQLVSANLRLVVSLAKTFLGSGVQLIDLIQAGNMGLMRSVDGFNYRLGFKFSTYASKWIFASITRMVSNQTRTVRIPVNVIPALKKIRLEEQQQLDSPEEHPFDENNAKKARKMAQILQFPVSLDQPLDGNGPTMLNTIRDDRPGASITENVDLSLVREQVDEIMVTLDPREQKVLKLRYGLEDGIEHTQAEVAQEMRFSRQRVSQIERRALLRLRATGQIQKLRHFLN